MSKPVPWAVVAVATALLTGCATRTVYESAKAAFTPPTTTSPATRPPAATTHPETTTPPTTLPTPSPVPTQAIIKGLCMPGLLDESTNTFVVMSGVSGDGFSDGDTVAEAYRMTLTNTGSTAAEVTGFSAVFYTGGNTETTSDTETFNSPTFLEPDQSLTWTETPWGSYTVANESPATGPFTSGEAGAVDISATCQLVQWTHP